jgi:hypothetical protein
MRGSACCQMLKNAIASLERGGYRTWLLLVVVTAALRLPMFFFVTKDEATYSALAAKMLAGSLFYVGAVDHKPPGIALTYAFVFWLTGQYRLLFVRILLLAVVAATSVLIGETARLLYGSPRARIAGVLYALASATGVPGDMLAANTELFLNLPLAAAGLLVVRALADDSDRLWPAATVTALAGAGALTGIAALFKYQAAAAVVGWALAVSAAGGGIRRIAPRLAALVAGIAPIALGLCAFYLLRAAWPAFWFWGWQYNFVYMSLVSPSAATWRALYYTTVVGLFWLPLARTAAGFRSRLAHRHDTGSRGRQSLLPALLPDAAAAALPARCPRRARTCRGPTSPPWVRRGLRGPCRGRYDGAVLVLPDLRRPGYDSGACRGRHDRAV